MGPLPKARWLLSGAVGDAYERRIEGGYLPWVSRILTEGMQSIGSKATQPQGMDNLTVSDLVRLTASAATPTERAEILRIPNLLLLLRSLRLISWARYPLMGGSRSDAFSFSMTARMISPTFSSETPSRLAISLVVMPS